MDKSTARKQVRVWSTALREEKQSLNTTQCPSRPKEGVGSDVESQDI